MGAEGGMDDEQRVDLGVSLLIPYRYTEDRVFRALQDAGFDDWTLAQCRLFQRVAPDGSRLTDLADQAQMSKQSAGVMVDQLERLGYVRRVSDPSDGRARLIVIEGRGLQAAEIDADDPQRDPLRMGGLPRHTQLHPVAADPGPVARDHRPLRALRTRPRRAARPRLPFALSRRGQRTQAGFHPLDNSQVCQLVSSM